MSDFINDVELIQRDYIDISRKIDEKFSQNQHQSKDLPPKDGSQSTAVNQTNLQRILNTSNSSVEDKESDDRRMKTNQGNNKNKLKKKKKERKSKLAMKSTADNLPMDTSEVSHHETTHEEQV